MRKVFFWLHLTAGVTAGLVVFVMAATGVLLTYERQMLDWANARLRTAPPPEASRLPLGALVAKVAQNEGGAMPTSATWRADSSAPVAVSFGRERTIYVNAYTGAILGEGAKGWRDFFRVTTDIHRWLATEGERRALGKGITGACNLAFLFLVLSGIYMWWPRQWRWKSVKAVMLFDWRLRGKLRDFNWHNVLGFWASLPLLVIVATGAVMSYPWANDLLYRLAGSEPPPRAAGGAGGAAPAGGQRRTEGARPAINVPALDRFAARAEQHVPGWQTISWRQPASFMIDQSHRGRPDLRVMLYLDAKTGEIANEEVFARQTPGRRARLWARWLHTGEAGGFLGQTLAGLASLAATVLVFTGLALSVRRFARRGAGAPPAG
jgi:uncharacterized iron-regulated membrane protein